MNKAMLPPECKLRADTENKSAPGTPLSVKFFFFLAKSGCRAVVRREKGVEGGGEGGTTEGVRKEMLLADERCAR